MTLFLRVAWRESGRSLRIISLSHKPRDRFLLFLPQRPDLRTHVSLLELLRSLASYEIGVSFHKTKNNQIRGISYHHGNQRLTGTQLGKTYTWPGLIRKRNLSYQPEQQSVLEELTLARNVNQVLNEQPSSLMNVANDSRDESTRVTTSATAKKTRSRRR